jgi:hypothetical protein
VTGPRGTYSSVVRVVEVVRVRVWVVDILAVVGRELESGVAMLVLQVWYRGVIRCDSLKNDLSVWSKIPSTNNRWNARG